MTTPQSPQGKIGDALSLLVCSSCDHPLCGAIDVIPSKLSMPADIGFSYEFDDILESSEDDGGGGGSPAPWCYRVNVSSRTVFDTRASEPTTAFSANGRVSPASQILHNRPHPTSMVQAFAHNFGPASDAETLSLLREGLAYERGGPISNVMLPLENTTQQDTSARIHSSPSSIETGSAQQLHHQPFSPTSEQRLSDMLIPPEVSKVANGNTDLIRVRESIAGVSVIDKFDDAGPTNNNFSTTVTAASPQVARYTPPDPKMDQWFEGYSVRSQLLCASCNASLGWRFGRGARPTTVQGDGEASSDPHSPIESATHTLVSPAVRANPFGPSAATAAQSLPVGHYGFMCLILKNIKHRTWSGKDVARQCLVAAAVARRQALELLHMSSPKAIVAASAVATPTGAYPNTSSASFPTPSITTMTPAEIVEMSTRRIASASQESQRLARIHTLLEEDSVSRRRLESLMNTKINEAVEERTRSLKTQAELVISLLEKHKEQTNVLSQLLRGQKDKLRTQEDKINTYEQIFNAHKRQLETQTKHITFQDDLMRTLKTQAECQQKQIESQQGILREQNSTIHKQNGHVREMQFYLRSLVESQVRIKQYLETISLRDATTNSPPAESNDETNNSGFVGGNVDVNEGDVDEVETVEAFAASPAGVDTTKKDSNDNAINGVETLSSPKIVTHLADNTSAVGAKMTSPNPPAAGKPKQMVLAGNMARLMLADLAKHEAQFGINYSALDDTSIAGQALRSVPPPPARDAEHDVTPKESLELASATGPSANNKDVSAE